MTKSTFVTEKQKKVLEGIAKGKSRKQAMLDAGYKESYASSGHIKDTESWGNLEAKYFNDTKVAKALDKLLKARTIENVIFPYSYKKEEVEKALRKIGIRKSMYYILDDNIIKIIDKEPVEFPVWRVVVGKPDITAISSGVDKILKIKGRYAPEQVEFDIGGLRKVSDKDLDKMIDEREIEIGIRKREK